MAGVLNQTFQSCTVKMILPRKAALCLGFNLPEVSENNQTKLLEKMWRKFRTYLNLYEWFDYFRQGHLKF